MEENNNMKGHIRPLFRSLLHLKSDKAPEEETVAAIKAGVDFKGANLWILIFAIFVASLGLNTNSAAVIIGAMLISPLMGPIVGMGLGIGIYDFELLKRAFRNFSIATLFSVLTATFYFAITPIDEAQSELLARTSPTIYDVLIALCGGMAGIIALCSSGQRGGNVIPGVAIATALMPPLCTTGFGLATGNWLYAAGAFYLYIINTIFISIATFIGVRIMDFRKKIFVDKNREKKVKNIIITISVLTILPAALLTYQMVRETVFTNKVNNFVSQIINDENCLVVTKESDFHNKTIRIVTIGDEISETRIKSIERLLPKFGLEGVRLNIVQGSKNLTAGELKNILNDPNIVQNDRNAQLLASEQKKIRELEKELSVYRERNKSAESICNEMKALFPEVDKMSLAYGMTFGISDTAKADTITLVHLSLQRKLSKDQMERITNWIKTRTGNNNINISTSSK